MMAINRTHKNLPIRTAGAAVAVLCLLSVVGCKPVIPLVTEPVRFEVTGQSANPVRIDWTIHDSSGSVASLNLNHTNGNPFVIERSIDASAYETVSFSIVDSGPTANNAVQTGADVLLSIGVYEKLLTLDADTEVPPGSGNFMIHMGDFFEDAAGNLMMITQEPDINREITVSDSLDDFVDGAWTLFTSNRSTITVNVIRNGIILHTSAASTDIDPVDLAYGSLSW